MGEAMNDLFQSIAEAQDERQAIQMADGITTTVEELHRCEVSTIVRRYFPDGDPKPFFADVEEKRGKKSADKLRDDCRIAWAAHREQVEKSKVAK